jgi:OFA family oxalate/formate antiporter-like MFS transporter
MKNRWVQLVGSVVAMVMIANLQYAWTLFVEPIQAARSWRLVDIQGAFNLFLVCETWIMPVEGWLIDRMGPRFFLSIASVLCGVGWTALGFVDALWQLYFFYAIAGVGAAFVYSGAIAMALKWFPDKRGLASGLIAAGFGSGSALFIPVIASIIHRESYQAAFLYSGVFQGVVILGAAQLLRNPGADFHASKAAAKPSSARVRRNKEQFTSANMLRTPHFYALFAMFVMMSTGGLMLTAEAGPLAKEWRITPAALTAALAMTRLANGSSRVFWGWVSDRLGREGTLAIGFFLHAGCLLSVLYFGRLSGALFGLTLTLTYFTWGEVFSVFPPTIGDYFGPANSASNYSFMYCGKGVASLIGVGLAALLHEKFGSWSAAFYGSAALAFISGLMAVGIRMVPLPTKMKPGAIAPAAARATQTAD